LARLKMDCRYGSNAEREGTAFCILSALSSIEGMYMEGTDRPEVQQRFWSWEVDVVKFTDKSDDQT